MVGGRVWSAMRLPHFLFGPWLVQREWLSFEYVPPLYGNGQQIPSRDRIFATGMLGVNAVLLDKFRTDSWTRVGWFPCPPSRPAVTGRSPVRLAAAERVVCGVSVVARRSALHLRCRAVVVSFAAVVDSAHTLWRVGETAMANKLIGYARVSTRTQVNDWQIEDLLAVGATLYRRIQELDLLRS